MPYFFKSFQRRCIQIYNCCSIRICTYACICKICISDCYTPLFLPLVSCESLHILYIWRRCCWEPESRLMSCSSLTYWYLFNHLIHRNWVKTMYQLYVCVCVCVYRYERVCINVSFYQYTYVRARLKYIHITSVNWECPCWDVNSWNKESENVTQSNYGKLLSNKLCSNRNKCTIDKRIIIRVWKELKLSMRDAGTWEKIQRNKLLIGLEC